MASDHDLEHGPGPVPCDCPGCDCPGMQAHVVNDVVVRLCERCAFLFEMCAAMVDERLRTAPR